METGQRKLVTAMSIKMQTEITYYGHGLLRGELYSQYLETPFEFYSLMCMIEKMEEIFDTKGYPEKFLKPRTFSSVKRDKEKREAERDDAMRDPIDLAISEEMIGSKCSFEVSVRFRQNATWQGEIIWAEKKLKQNFRSVLEMLKLMDEALMDGVERPERIDWKR